MSIVTVNLSGRLGNYYFIIISAWAYAKKHKKTFVINSTFKNNALYSFFRDKVDLVESTNFGHRANFGVYSYILDYVYDGDFTITGFLQNSNNFNIYRTEVLKHFFDIKDILQPNNNFFIHIRLTVFLYSSKHYVCKNDYYERAIEIVKQNVNINNLQIYIISDDIEKAKDMKFLSCFNPNQLMYIGKNQYNVEQTLEVFKNCYIGGIISNSTFAWWGAYIINNSNKVIIAPSKFINGNFDFSGLYMDYIILDV